MRFEDFAASADAAAESLMDFLGLGMDAEVLKFMRENTHSDDNGAYSVSR